MEQFDCLNGSYQIDICNCAATDRSMLVTIFPFCFWITKQPPFET
jgi:hypothetical protein